MSEALLLRNAKMEELRRIKGKKVRDSDSEQLENTISSALEGIKEEVSIDKPSNPSSVPDSDIDQVKKELSQIPYLEIEELAIKQLKIQLEILEKNESLLQIDSETMKKENQKLHQDRRIFLNSHEDLKKICENLQNDLENALEKVKQKHSSLCPAKSRLSHNEEILELRAELQSICSQIEEKDQEIEVLNNAISRIREESSGLLNSGAYFSQPEPPPPINSSRRLLSDVGSTGTWAHKPEESKVSQFASPDPFENLFHQSTGETQHNNKEEPATPPNEYTEERKIYIDEEEKVGTPKRKPLTKTNFYVS